MYETYVNIFQLHCTDDKTESGWLVAELQSQTLAYLKGWVLMLCSSHVFRKEN